MKVLRLVEASQPPTLVRDLADMPSPGRGELLIRVCAAGVILTELSWSPTTHTKTGEPRVGAIPGHEFSGLVAGAGADAGSFEIAQEVYGMNDWYSDGAMAEYCVAPVCGVAPKPQHLSHVEAASIPISALTAWQGLFDRAKLQGGERVLVHGGAGAVGTMVIQLAKLHGAEVIATASARNREFVAHLGATQVIDYREARFEEQVKDVDVVFDTVGGDTLERSWGVLKPGGRLVTVVSTAANSTDDRVKKAFFIVEPNQKQLVEVGALLDSGRLHPAVDAVIRFSHAAEAYAGETARQGRGKLVIALGDADRIREELQASRQGK